MSSFEEYIRNRQKDEKDFKMRLAEIAAAVEELKADSEANAEAIEELAAIIGGEE